MVSSAPARPPARAARADGRDESLVQRRLEGRVIRYLAVSHVVGAALVRRHHPRGPPYGGVIARRSPLAVGLVPYALTRIFGVHLGPAPGRLRLPFRHDLRAEVLDSLNGDGHDFPPALIPAVPQQIGLRSLLPLPHPVAPPLSGADERFLALPPCQLRHVRKRLVRNARPAVLFAFHEFPAMPLVGADREHRAQDHDTNGHAQRPQSRPVNGRHHQHRGHHRDDLPQDGSPAQRIPEPGAFGAPPHDVVPEKRGIRQRHRSQHERPGPRGGGPAREPPDRERRTDDQIRPVEEQPVARKARATSTSVLLHSVRPQAQEPTKQLRQLRAVRCRVMALRWHRAAAAHVNPQISG